MLAWLVLSCVAATSCGHIIRQDDGLAPVSIYLPPLGSSSGRAIASTDIGNFRGIAVQYRVAMNDRTVMTTGGVVEERFVPGVTVSVAIECLDSSGTAILRTVTKSIVAGRTSSPINFSLKTDGEPLVAASVSFGGTATAYETFDEAWAFAQGLATSAASRAVLTMLSDAVISAYKEVPAGAYLTLDLNGKTLDRGLAGQAAVAEGYSIKIASGGDFVLKDSGGTGKITGGNNTGNGGGIANNGTFSMYGGIVTANNSNNGGGIYIDSGGTFNMHGGKITGNTATEFAGGILAYSTLNIYAGEISNNTAAKGGGIRGTSEINIYGGVISGNRASGPDMGGGAIYTGGITTMYDGIIKNNYSKYGGAVLVPSNNIAKFIMQGGTITGNNATYGGGIYINESNGSIGTFTMNSGSITNNTATTKGGGVYADAGSTFNGNGSGTGGNSWIKQ